MFRKVFVTGALAMSMLGCTTTSTGTKVIDPALVDTVQAATTAACSFLPLASTIASLVSLNNPAVSTAEQIAQAICGSVAGPAAASAKRTGALPSYDGVIIQGRFVSTK